MHLWSADLKSRGLRWIISVPGKRHIMGCHLHRKYILHGVSLTGYNWKKKKKGGGAKSMRLRLPAFAAKPSSWVFLCSWCEILHSICMSVSVCLCVWEGYESQPLLCRDNSLGVLARKRAEKKVEKIGEWRENLTAHEQNLISFLSLSSALALHRETRAAGKCERAGGCLAPGSR